VCQFLSALPLTLLGIAFISPSNSGKVSCYRWSVERRCGVQSGVQPLSKMAVASPGLDLSQEQLATDSLEEMMPMRSPLLSPSGRRVVGFGSEVAHTVAVVCDQFVDWPAVFECMGMRWRRLFETCPTQPC
jgi:hypothetical protein